MCSREPLDGMFMVEENRASHQIFMLGGSVLVLMSMPVLLSVILFGGV